MKELRFQVLGPLSVWRDGVEIQVSSERQRAVLGLLLLRAGSPVARHEIIDAVWGSSAPPSVVNLIQTYIARLRRHLEPHRRARDGDRLLVTTGAAYAIQADRAGLDLARFRSLLAEARGSPSREESLAMLLSALRTWQGPCLADLDHVLRGHPWVRAVDQERIDAVLEAARVAVQLGRQRDVVPQLRAIAASEPLNEMVHAQLVLALAASGAAADALAVYEAVRARLAEDLGIDPGPELREAHLQVLRRAASPADPDRGQLLQPSLLPPDLPDFTGRARVLGRLRDELAEAGAGPRFVLLTGRGGAGKTALAVHLAHQLRDAFPDGQLCADLLGSTLSPADPLPVLARFLRSLGIASHAMPRERDDLVDLYRTHLADRRVLVVLDDAAGPAQVRPLLPGTRACAVVATSRSPGSGWPEARTVEVGALPPDEGVELLSALAGGDRVAAEPGTAAEVERLCDGLPLALRVAGSRLAARPHWSLSWLAGRLADDRRRLDELAHGDLDVRATLASSCQRLDGAARRAFRLLGLLQVPTFTSWMAATTLEAPLDQAEKLMDVLADGRLLEVAGMDASWSGRYRLPDLNRLYARELAATEDGEHTCRMAVTRVLAALLALTEEAGGRLGRHLDLPQRSRAPRWPLPAPLRERLLADPVAWYRSEQPCLVAAVAQAAAMGSDDLAWELASSFAVMASRLQDWEPLAEVYRAALAACRAAGNRLGEAVMLRGLGELESRLGATSPA